MSHQQNNPPTKEDGTDLPANAHLDSESKQEAPGQVVQGKDDLGGLVKGKERKKII